MDILSPRELEGIDIPFSLQRLRKPRSQPYSKWKTELPMATVKSCAYLRRDTECWTFVEELPDARGSQFMNLND